MHPVELHAHAIRSAVERVPGLRPGEIDDVIGGVVGQVGEPSGSPWCPGRTVGSAGSSPDSCSTAGSRLHGGPPAALGGAR